MFNFTEQVLSTTDRIIEENEKKMNWPVDLEKLGLFEGEMK